MQKGSQTRPFESSTKVVFVFTESLAAVAASAGLGVVAFYVPLEAGIRPKPSTAHWAVKWTVGGVHIPFLWSPVARLLVLFKAESWRCSGTETVSLS